MSLQPGHRKSVDADFFSDKSFDNNTAEEKLAKLLPGFGVMKKSPHGFAGFFDGIKLDLYTWNVPPSSAPAEAQVDALVFNLYGLHPEEAELALAALPGVSATESERIMLGLFWGIGAAFGRIRDNR